MKRMKDNAIEAGLRRISTGYNRYGTFTIDESNRPISFNAGFVPVKMVEGQSNLKYDDVHGGENEVALDLSGIFTNSEDDNYQQFLDGEKKDFSCYGMFLIGLETLGVECFMTGYLSLVKDSNGKPIIDYCKLIGYNGDDDTGGYLEISDGIISLGLYAK